ncbi:MAG: hypothetical protein RBJ76_01490 [Stenomitos frigidus ULC029]
MKHSVSLVMGDRSRHCKKFLDICLKLQPSSFEGKLRSAEGLPDCTPLTPAQFCQHMKRAVNAARKSAVS